MSGPHLPDNFAMQSKMPEQRAETVTSIFPIDGERGMAIVIEMSRAAPTSLRIDGLLRVASIYSKESARASRGPMKAEQSCSC